MTKTKILATVGPSTNKPDKIKALCNVGVDCFRVNTAYGNRNEYSYIYDVVRESTDAPIVFDLKGPEVRLNGEKSKNLVVGSEFEVGFNKDYSFYFNHDFYNQISVGDRVYIDNGEIETEVVEKKIDSVILESLGEGVVYDGKGINFPDLEVETPTFTERDRSLIKHGLELGVDYYALSFTRNKQDIVKLKSMLNNESGVIAKIENKRGLENFKEIVDIVDCVMVARGDLGIEVSLEKVPLAQKKMIKISNKHGVPVITATEVLESMIEKPTPTRAEVSDAANAILDGTDAIMLSGETSIGKYPVKSVRMIKKISKEIEPAIKKEINGVRSKKIPESISKAVYRLCQDMDIDKVVALSKTGYTSRMISRFRIKQPIITVTPYHSVFRKQKIVYGVQTIQKNYLNQKNPILYVAGELKKKGYIDREDTVLFTSTSKKPLDQEGDNIIEIHKINELKLNKTNRKYNRHDPR
ncbi:pyruvate kinase [Methanonatronarchaeum sp. AMET-Sl]|uniref:pyruvate kinase n=1 Tax=Methanonatronarchaeum sp. AMET-Sl TaxID=3037654 RepID=UPI00244DFEE0|nr:pyruvate kinase [Methanonatronarchaeum sp. AMET-Sl]WGI17257.1 pyruvate kinase [Methanonatronarchaeum sp. AMET-Sl]